MKINMKILQRSGVQVQTRFLSHGLLAITATRAINKEKQALHVRLKVHILTLENPEKAVSFEK